MIDYNRGVVTVGGEEVKLTHTEYNILDILFQNSGKVLTYSAIKKLGARPGTENYIINELGVGYCINDT